MDSVKIYPLLPNKWQMKSLVWQQNRHHKVYGGLYICAVGGLYRGRCIVQWGLTFCNLNKHHCFIVLHISIWGRLELCFGGAKLTKVLPPRGERAVWQNFSLLFNAIDLEK